MSIRIGAIIYLIAAFIQIFAPDLVALIVGRSIQGLGVGMLSMTVPILQCEIAPGHSRGLFISIEYLCLNLGYLISAWVGYGFFFALPSEISWRGPYIVQAVLAGILTLWTFVLPETPRFLISNGFKDEGLRVLADLHAAGDITDPGIKATFVEISAAVEYEKDLGQASWAQLFRQYTRRAVMGLTCQMFAQFNGINALLYFLPGNLSRAGFTIARSLLYAGVAAIVYCVGTIPTMFLIDRWGRRPFLITGSFALASCLAVVGGLQFKADSLPEGDARLPYADGIFAGTCYSSGYQQIIASHTARNSYLPVSILLWCNVRVRPHSSSTFSHSQETAGDPGPGCLVRKSSPCAPEQRAWPCRLLPIGSAISSSHSSHHRYSQPSMVDTTSSC